MLTGTHREDLSCFRLVDTTFPEATYYALRGTTVITVNQ